MKRTVEPEKVCWGVLGAAKIAVEEVIPAMQSGLYSQVKAIASRSPEKARQAAVQLGIPKSYGSYDELLADPNIDAVYIPLPNHLHVPWAERALQAGKHVLCEKPIALDGTEARNLLLTALQYPELKVMEAFMYRHHPQWQLARRLVTGGEIGELRTVHSAFAYHIVDPTNIVNVADFGGGGLLDIGCYPISLSRFLFDREPERVCGIVEIDPEFGVDRLVSGILDFGGGTATFTCGTQLADDFQRVNIFGTRGMIEIEIPFNAPKDKPCKVVVQTEAGTRTVLLEISNQYTIQGDLFSLAILNDLPVPTPLEDAVANMEVIDRLLQSAESGLWI